MKPANRNSKNMPGWKQRAQDGLADSDALVRRYLAHYMVFAVSQLPQIAKDELEFRQAAILQRYRPDVFKAAFPDWKGRLDDMPGQFTVE